MLGDLSGTKVEVSVVISAGAASRTYDESSLRLAGRDSQLHIVD
jgi:hypothetical protein